MDQRSRLTVSVIQMAGMRIAKDGEQLAISNVGQREKGEPSDQKIESLQVCLI